MSQTRASKWDDLKTRILSAVAMLIVGACCIWIGGTLFRSMIAIVAALMIWELVHMSAPHERTRGFICAGFTGLSVFIAPLLAGVPFWAIEFVPVLAVLLASGKYLKSGVPYALLIALGATTLVLVRENLAPGWLIWLLCVVIITDVAGYFAGKVFGGPKFWPAISPSKTWSGTSAGWICAAGVGAVFGYNTGVTFGVIALSIILSIAAQMGDLFESSIKRKAGVKDSSRLIPGHGGVLDRFDGLLAASVALLVVALLTGFPRGLL